LNIGEFLVENCEAMVSQLDDLSNLDKYAVIMFKERGDR
jgi:hypothetical protein